MKKAGKIIAIILIVVIILAGAIGGFIYYKIKKTAIGSEAALDAALKDAGLERSAVYDVEKDYLTIFDFRSTIQAPSREAARMPTDPEACKKLTAPMC